jgi:4-hydroxybenzoate polyprenyltransferase
LKNIWQRFHDLSLNVVLGAVCSQAMVFRLSGLLPDVSQLLILAGIVWLIYTADHLSDAQAMRSLPLTSRHRFHFLHQRSLWLIATGLALGLILTIPAFLPRQVLIFGGISGVCTLIYLLAARIFTRQSHTRFYKEIFISIIFTIAIWGSVWVRKEVPDRQNILLCLIFWGVTLQNLLLFSWYEVEEDRQQEQLSMAVSLGKSWVQVLFRVISGMIVLVALWSQPQGLESKAMGIELLMSAILLMLLSYPAVFRKNQRYRWIGDGVFLLPALIFFDGF